MLSLVQVTPYVLSLGVRRTAIFFRFLILTFVHRVYTLFLFLPHEFETLLWIFRLINRMFTNMTYSSDISLLNF